MMDIEKTILLIVIGIFVPFLCYFFVSECFSLFYHLYLQIKAMRFRKRVHKTQKKAKNDTLEEIEIETISSYDRKRK